MSFHWPHLFWFLLLPAGLGIAELFRRVRSSAGRYPKILRGEASPTGVNFDAPGSARAEPQGRVRWRLWLGLALVVTALARPQWGLIEEPVFEQAREILIAVDLSKSMLAPDVSPSRLERAKLLIVSLLERLEGERVGLIVFSGTAFLQSPLSADYEILREFLPALSPRFLPEGGTGGTNYTALLDTALDAFGDESDADRFLIILSDGESQSDDWEQRIPELRERGIQVLGLGIGTADGAMLPDGAGGFVKDERGAVVLSRLNQSTLEELSRRTAGTYRDASTWVDLADLLAQTVETGRQGDFTETRRARLIERFQWALGPAMMFLLWSFWRELPVHPRSRAVQIQPRSRDAVRPAARATVATLIAIGLIGANLVSPRARAATPEDDPLGAPLSLLVGRLATAEQIDAIDFAELASETINYGQSVIASGQKPSLGVLYDGLDAVDAGELLDDTAADWPALRDAIQQLIDHTEEPPPEDQQQQQDDQQQDDNESQENDDQQEDGEQSGDQQQESGDGKSDQQDGQGDSSEQNQDGSEGDQSEQDSEGEQSEENSESSGEEPSEEQRQNAESAFGDMDDQPEPPPEPPAQPRQQTPQTQRVGGQQTQNADAAANPELAVPLQKLDQLKKQDSPAQLFQLMQDPNAQPPANGRDW